MVIYALFWKYIFRPAPLSALKMSFDSKNRLQPPLLSCFKFFIKNKKQNKNWYYFFKKTPLFYF